jgi:TolA-binding protein
MVLDSEGREQYRFSGYLPAPDFLAELYMGLGKSAFAHKHWAEAERWFQAIGNEFPETDAAPEALYWAGVCRYKASNDPHVLGHTAQLIAQRYPRTSWAKRSSVWLQKAA